MTDIVEELRYSAETDHDSTGYVMEKAADEIERLRADLMASCREERAMLGGCPLLTERERDGEIERLRASNAELVAALKEIAHVCGIEMLASLDGAAARGRAVDIACAATAKAKDRAPSFVSEHGEGDGYG